MPTFKKAKNNKLAIVYTYKGITGTIKELYDHFTPMQSLNTIRWRLRNGYNIERAFDEPRNEYQRKVSDAGYLNKTKQASLETKEHPTKKIMNEIPLHERICHPKAIRDKYLKWTGERWEFKDKI